MKKKPKNENDENKKIMDRNSQKMKENRIESVRSLKKRFELGQKNHEKKPEFAKKLRPISTHFQVSKGGSDLQNKSVLNTRGVSASDDRFLENVTSTKQKSLKTHLVGIKNGLTQEGTANGKRKLQNILDDSTISKGGQSGKRRQLNPDLLSADHKTGLGNFKSI